MSEGSVTFAINADSSEAFAEIARFRAAHDKAVKEMREERDKTIRGIREGFRMLASLISSYREIMAIMGQTIDPFFDALLSVVAATVSMMLSVATGLLATGVGGVAGAVVIGIALGLQIVTTSILIANKIEIMAEIAGIERGLPSVTMGLGVSF